MDDKIIEELVRDLCSVECRTKSRTKKLITTAFAKQEQEHKAQIRSVVDRVMVFTELLIDLNE